MGAFLSIKIIWKWFCVEMITTVEFVVYLGESLHDAEIYCG